MKLETSILSLLSDAVIKFNEEQIITEVNDSALNLFAYSQSELLGQNLAIIIPPAYRNRHSNLFQAFMNEETTSRFMADRREVLAMKKDGTTFYAHISLLKLRENDNSCVTTIIRNTSLIRQLALDVEKQSLALEQERQLNSMQAQFITMVSHEFRTPMSIIKLFTGTLKLHYKDLTEAQIQDRLHHVDSAIHRLDTLISEMLFLERSHQSAYAPKNEIVSIENFLMELAETTAVAFPNKGPINIETPDKFEKVFIDKHLLEHIFVNLFSNALKYSPDHTPVSVKAYYDSDKLHISVRDRGRGIPVQDLQKLFQPFMRASNVENIQGIGLGLNIVKRSVELLGGTISCKSKEGLGTSFILELPCEVAVAK